MSKKILVLLTLFPFYLFSKTIYAANVLPEKDSFSFLSRLYAGLSVGGELNQYKLQTTTTTQFPSSAFFSGTYNNANIFASNAQGAIFLGFLYAVPTDPIPIYIGPEIYGSISNPTFSTGQSANATLPTETLDTLTSGHLNSGEGDIDLRIGAMAQSGTLLFARVGAAFNTLSATTTSAIARPALPLASIVNNTYSAFIAGLRIGGGIEQQISSVFGIRADYIFTSYPSRHFSATQPSNPAESFQLAPISNITTIQMNTNTILFSLIYKDIHWT